MIFQPAAGPRASIRIAFLCILPVLVLMPSTATFAQDGQRKCSIRSMIGTVKVRHGAGPNWTDARPKMPLTQKDALRTFVESEAEIETGEGTVITLSENSTIELSTFSLQSGPEQQTRVKIMSGKVLSNVAKLTSTRSRFEFETPTATAAIRGTLVGFEVTGQETQIKVFDGKVFVVPAGATGGAELGRDQMTTIRRGQRTVEILSFKEEPPVRPVADTVRTDTSKADSTAHTPADTAATGSRDTTAQIRAATADTARDSARAAASATLSLVVTMPPSGRTFTPSAQIDISGKVAPPTARVTVRERSVAVTSTGDFRASIPAPAQPGDYEIDVTARTTTETKTVSVAYKVAPAARTELRLTLNAPLDGQVVRTPSVTIAGLATPGALVQCSGLRIPTSSDGSFSAQVPLADEEGSHAIEVDALLGDRSTSVTRTVEYRRDRTELRLTVNSPYDKQIFTMTSVPIRGLVSPASAAVTVTSESSSKRLAVGADGAFTGFVDIPAEDGEHVIEFEAADADRTVSAARTAVFQRPPDTDRPTVYGAFPACVRQGAQVMFTVSDRTVDDEITFYREIDGTRDSETGRPNSAFSVTLDEGCHNYTVYASDKQGNQSPRITARTCYQPRTLIIRMRKPTARESRIRVPPDSPDGGFEPVYTVEFRIDNLPYDYGAVGEIVKEVTVTNRTTGRSQMLRNLTDIEVEADVDLRRASRNDIEIRVLDACGQVVTNTIAIIVQ